MDFSIVKGTHQTTATPASVNAPQHPSRGEKPRSQRQPERGKPPQRQSEGRAKKGGRGGRRR
jgi:hypothetical protein